MAIYRQSQNWLYCQDVHVNRIRLIAQPWSQSLIVFYILVFDRIHDAMCLNKMSRTSSRNIGPQHQKYSSIFNCTHGVLFIPVFTKHILSVCCKKLVFSFIWLHLFLDELGSFFLKPSQNNMRWCRCCFTILRFSDPETQLFSAILQLWSLDTRPLPGSFVTFSVDWKFLIIALMVEMWIFTVLALFLKSLH